jgi:endonuclease YncB( thermonuclease family)
MGGPSMVWAVAFAAEFAWLCGQFGAAAQQPLAAVAVAVPSAPTLACGGDEIARGRFSRILDGSNFVLDDGREVHLAGIEVPLLPVPGSSLAVPGGAAAKAALAGLLSGSQVGLRRAEFASDRYGRIIAYVEALAENSPRSVQAELVSAGFARVGDDAGGAPCAAELLRRENVARRAKLGLWADSYYDPLRADEPAAILAQRGAFALVEGTVASIHDTQSTLYVNFGRRWSRDFSVTIRKRNQRNFAAAGVDLKRLAGRRVRVRGWIEAHDGDQSGAASGSWHAPWIEAARPVQLELDDHD